MEVALINYTTGALDLLIGTKTTRMRGKDPADMTETEKYEHFQYMLDTIRSPFDFVDYIFEIKGVSKNFTHQLVRTRSGAYQQETGRALEQSAFETIRPEAFDHDANEMLAHIWDDAIADADAAYQELIDNGAELQDARAILPSNLRTSIKAKFSLRTLSDMARVRLCTRTQGEYQNAFRLMIQHVVEVHPWADPLLQVSCVGTGKCAFPRHGKEHCRFYAPWMDTTVQQEELRKVFWATELTTNNPVAKDGKSTG